MNKLGSDYKSQKEFAICLAIAISTKSLNNIHVRSNAARDSDKPVKSI